MHLLTCYTVEYIGQISLAVVDIKVLQSSEPPGVTEVVLTLKQNVVFLTAFWNVNTSTFYKHSQEEHIVIVTGNHIPMNTEWCSNLNKSYYKHIHMVQAFPRRKYLHSWYYLHDHGVVFTSSNLTSNTPPHYPQIYMYVYHIHVPVTTRVYICIYIYMCNIRKHKFLLILKIILYQGKPRNNVIIWLITTSLTSNIHILRRVDIWKR